ncbi:hypothetical protein AB0C02_02385 [Micromonospora sp. NPDC048999]|uniref:hypothetical protein n=1 Tax=Micromonospora sp. NPDC048999 TaxID=3155391 RepID=UPI0033D77452
MPFDVQDLSGTFSVGDIAIALSLSFLLSAMIGWVYRFTHRNVSATATTSGCSTSSGRTVRRASSKPISPSTAPTFPASVSA